MKIHTNIWRFVHVYRQLLQSREGVVSRFHGPRSISAVAMGAKNAGCHATRRAGWRAKPMRCRTGRMLSFLAVMAFSALAAHVAIAAPVNVLTNHNDGHNDGENLHETTLTLHNVRPGSFGKLFATHLDGVDYGQPLFVAHVDITTGPHRGVQDVIYAATARDTVYAINANNGKVLWKTNLLTRFHSPQDTVLAREENPNWAAKNEPLEDTPVIDLATHALYVECEETEQGPGTGGKVHWIHLLSSLNLSNGRHYAKTVKIAECGPRGAFISGPTVRKINGRPDHFNAYEITFRYVAIDPVNHVLYLACADPGDIGAYNGWILGYSTVKNAAGQLAVKAVWSATPNGWAGGIWGGAIAMDHRGNLFVETGNGTFETHLIKVPYAGRLSTDSPRMMVPAKGDYGDAALKLSPDSDTYQHADNPNGFGLHVSDYFVPKNEMILLRSDLDLGSSSPVLLPPSVGDAAHRHLVVINDKPGTIYLLDRDHMGGYHGDPAGDGKSGFNNVLQTLVHATGSGFSTGAFFAGDHSHRGWIYYAEVSDNAKAFLISHAHIDPHPVSVSRQNFGYPGATPEISADGAHNVILWLLCHFRNRMLAFNAANLKQVLFDSSKGRGRDGISNKLTGTEIDMNTYPTVTNGRAYVSTTTALNVYGLLAK